MEKKTKILLTILIVTILIIVAGTFAYVWLNGADSKSSLPTPNLEFRIINNTAIVENILADQTIELNWKNIIVHSGNATLPIGDIKIGDVITNCSGEVSLLWVPHDVLIWDYDFS